MQRPLRLAPMCTPTGRWVLTAVGSGSKVAADVAMWLTQLLSWADNWLWVQISAAALILKAVVMLLADGQVCQAAGRRCRCCSRLRTQLPQMASGRVQVHVTHVRYGCQYA